MQIKLSKRGTTLIIGVYGELDHHSAEYVRQKVDSEIMRSSTKNIIFDFTKLSFMDSSGIGVIMGRFKNIQKLNGKSVIVNANEQIKRLLEMSGILRIIPMYNTLDEAVAFLN